jgi:hypothetical protein
MQRLISPSMRPEISWGSWVRKSSPRDHVISLIGWLLPPGPTA